MSTQAGEGTPQEPAWLHPHVHEPNPTPPPPDPTLTLTAPDGATYAITVDVLAQLPRRRAQGCYIVSTGHGTSGPFDFEGVALDDLIAAYIAAPWQSADVVSADGFGARIQSGESYARTALLALMRDGETLTRDQGLVRLIVPNERDDALRQVKWVARIIVA